MSQHQPQPRPHAAQIAHHKADFEACSATAHSTFIAGVCTGLALYRLLQLLGVLI